MSWSRLSREDLEEQLDIAKERIKQLEAELGASTVVSSKLNLTGHQRRFLGILLKRDIATRDALMLGLYGNRSDPPNAQTLSVHLCHLRRRLRPLGVTIRNHWGQGYSLSPADKAVINEMTAAERGVTSPATTG